MGDMTAATPKPLDYLAVASCGCIRGWCAAERAQDLAGDLAAWIRASYSLERVTTDEARSRQWSCDGTACVVPKKPAKPPHHAAPAAATQTLLPGGSNA
jgi:hypothetical protein